MDVSTAIGLAIIVASIDGFGPPEPKTNTDSLSTPPEVTPPAFDQRGQSVENQANIAGDQYAAGRDITLVKGNQIRGKKVTLKRVLISVPIAIFTVISITLVKLDYFAGDKVQGDKVGNKVEISNIVNPAPTPPAPESPHQIPSPPTDFVGRQKETTESIEAIKGTGRGVVITGMPGVGAEELAKVVAERLKDRFPDGQIYLDLRGASQDDSRKPVTPAEALAHVVQSFLPEAKLPEDPDQLRGRYYSVLNGKRVLLLMENARDAGQLAPLTPPPEGCALIVTSRQHLALSGISTVALNPLTSDESQEMLLRICPRIAERANALAQHCGCLPLALRLAASALKTRPTLGIEDYIKDLSTEQGRLATLDKYKNATDVAVGVEASLAISYNLLEDPAKRHWRALSVFPADFDAQAAGGVWQLDEKDAKTALADLYAASMVQWDEPTNRFSLHALVRDYARTRSSEEERAECEQRHAAYYAEVLPAAEVLYQKGGDSILQGLALFDCEWGNIRAGQAWAATQRRLDRTAAHLCSVYPGLAPRCLGLRLHSCDQIAWLQAAIDAARIVEDRRAEGGALNNLGLAYADVGEMRRAIEFHDQALVIYREIGDRRDEGYALANLGNAYAGLGQTRKASEHYEQTLAIAREIGDPFGEGIALRGLGNAYKNLGETREAIKYYEQDLLIARELGDRQDEGNALCSLGNAYGILGEARKAIDFQEQALVIDRDIGDRHGEGVDLHNLAITFAALGQTRKAIEHFEQALTIARDIGDPHGEANALVGIGNAYVDLCQPQEAIEFHEQALVIEIELGDRCGEGNTLVGVGNACYLLGETQKATEHFEQALAIAQDTGDPRAQALALSNLGNAHADLGETQQAIQYYETALMIERKTGDAGGEGTNHLNLADELIKIDRRDEAISHAEQAVKILEQIESPQAAKARAHLELLQKQTDPTDKRAVQ